MPSEISEVKRLFKHSSHYLIANMLVMAGSFVSLPILTRIFSPSEYGAFGLVTATVFVLVAVAKFGAQYSAVRYYSECTSEGKEAIALYYSTFFFQALLFGCVTASLFLLLSKLFPIFGDPQFNRLLWLVAALCLTDTLINRFQNFVRVEQRTKLFSVISVIGRYGRIGAGLLAVFLFSRSVFSYFSAHVLVNITIIAVLVFPLFTKKRIKWAEFSLPLFRRSVLYGFPLFLLEISTLLFRFIDRYLIQAKLNAAALGIYTVGANISQYTADVIFLPVALAIFPIYMEIWANKGQQEVEAFLSKVANYLLMFCVPIAFGLCLLSKVIVTTLASDRFAASSKIIPFISTGALIWGFYHVLAAGLYIHNKTKILAFVILSASCLNVMLNLLLIPVLGMMGPAISIFISYIVMTILVVMVAFRYVKVYINLLNIMKYVMASVVMCMVISAPRLNRGLYVLAFAAVVGPVTYAVLLMSIDRRTRVLMTRFLKAGREKIIRQTKPKIADEV